MSSSIINDQWENFRDKVLPLAASEIQRIEMQRAFMAGALCSIMELVNTQPEKQQGKTRAIIEELNLFIDTQILMDVPPTGGD